jgi:pilus assembly protein CpaD
MTGNALDRRDVSDMAKFAGVYKKYGKGLMMISIPRGSNEDALAAHTVKAIRLVLTKAGIPAKRIQTTVYDASEAVGSPPVRLSFLRLAAEVDSQCGLYPTDLTDAKDQRDYWNLGCAYQNQLAQQVDDPRDLFQARQESLADTTYRMSKFEGYRETAKEYGKDN